MNGSKKVSRLEASKVLMFTNWIKLRVKTKVRNEVRTE
jgi:hypothetical protein